MFDAQFHALSWRCRVVRYDLHGFGRSGTPDRAYSHHAALHALLQHLGIDRPALLGMSLGAGVALDYALTYPGRVTALALLAAGIGGYRVSDATVALGAPIAEAFQMGDFARAIEPTVRIWFDGRLRRPEEVDQAVRERFREMCTDMLRRSRDGLRGPEPLDPPAVARLREIDVPTLVVVGAGDIPDILDQADLLERSIAGARKVVLPRVAHLLNMERPDEVNRIVLEFLEEHLAAVA